MKYLRIAKEFFNNCKSIFLKFFGYDPKSGLDTETSFDFVRESWAYVAKKLNLEHQQKEYFEDILSGNVLGIPVQVQNECNFDCQKMITKITVFSKEQFFLPKDIDEEKLFMAYDQSIHKYGSIEMGFVSQEDRKVFYGCAIENFEDNLRYWIIYGLRDSEQMIKIIRSMVIITLQLAKEPENNFQT